MNKKIITLLLALSTNAMAEKVIAPQAVPVTITIPDLSEFWKSCREYILSPIVKNLVEKKVADMSIGDMSKTLETKIQKEMGEFVKYGQEAKGLAAKKATREEIEARHMLMANIYHYIRPAESTVRGMYPKMTRLFDQLNNLYPDQYTQLDYEIDEKMFMATEKEVDKVFTEIKEPVTVKPIETKPAPVEKVEPAQTAQEDEADGQEAEDYEEEAPARKSWW